MLAFAVYLIGSVAIPPANAGQSAPGPAPAEAGAGACPSLTSEAIQTAIDRIALSRVKAASDAAVHGVEGGPGYPSAARDNVVYLDLAHDKMVTLLDWLHSADLLDHDLSRLVLLVHHPNIRVTRSTPRASAATSSASL